MALFYSQAIEISGSRPASQAERAGSIPATRSSKTLIQARQPATLSWPVL